jgi:hypothetical protein
MFAETDGGRDSDLATRLSRKCLIPCAATIASTANRLSVNPCLANLAESGKSAGHQPLTRRAMPGFLSIRLTHVS